MRAGRVAVGIALLGSFSLGCGDGSARASIAEASAQLAIAAAAITGQQAPLAQALRAAEAEATGYPGFDTGVYPGDAVMRTWRTGDAPYLWTGYYLPAPCHPDDGWSGKRQTLTDMGYGLAVIYVGQQTWGRKPGAPYMVPVKVPRKVKVRVGRGRNRRTVTRTVTRTVLRRAPPPPADATCSADFVSAARGRTEGIDAVARMAAEGFERGTIVFLDIERMDFMHQRMRDYYIAWVKAVLADGRFRPGIYVHTYNAEVVYADVKGVYTGAGLTEEPHFWVAKSAGFDLEKLPHEVGHAFATVWQGVLDVEQTYNGKRIKLDVNVAGSPNPSVPMGR